MSFGRILLNQSIGAMQNYATWIQIALSCISKTENACEDIADDVKKKLIHQIMRSIDHYPRVKVKRSDWTNER